MSEAAPSALQAAGVALLEPLMRADSPARINQALADAIERCAQTGQASGLRSLSYLSAVAAPFLRQGGLTGDASARQDLLEPWVHDLLAFCAGQLEGEEVAALVKRLEAWPGLTPIPAEFAQLIIERLQRDARLLAPERESAANEPETDSARQPETDSAQQPAPGPPAEVEIARDELDMLALECAQLQDELVPQLAAIEYFSAIDPRVASHLEVLQDYRERLHNLTVALGHLSWPTLADPIQALLAALDRALAPDHADWGPLRPVLLELPALLLSYFQEPTPDTARDLAARLASRGGSGADAAAQMTEALSSLRVVASRRIAARDPIDVDEPMSLQPRADTDRQVIAQLMQELPAASEQFTHAIEKLRDGDLSQLAIAQRIAHTIKGAANTAGIQGVAVLTHQLEDVLQIVQASNRQPAPELAELLVSSSDCLAEMSEHLIGIGPEPQSVAAHCAALSQWVNRLLAREGGDEPARDRDPESLDGADALGEPVTPGDPTAQGDPATRGDPTTRGDPATQGDPATRGDPATQGDPATNGLAAGRAGPFAAEEGAGAPFSVPVMAGVPVPTATPVFGPHAAFDTTSESVDGIAAEPAPGVASGEAEHMLQVPASLIDKLLGTISEASIKLAQLQERLGLLDDTRVSFRGATDGIQVLSSELERLVDVRGVALTGKSGQQDFDPAELDEYNDLHTVARRIVEAGADNRILDRNLDQNLFEVKELSGQIELLQVEMQDLVMRTRSAPFASIGPRLQRAVRQAARMAGKSVELKILGAHTDIDGQMLLALVDPIAHILRNAVDHGIEPADKRVALGKPAAGCITLSVERDHGSVRIECADDGAGLDRAAIRARANALGIVAAETELAPDEVARLILRAGFSTRAQADQLSGRGIGLDVVQQSLMRLRGRIQIADQQGVGTRFVLTVPLTMANQAVMVISDPRYRFALATQSIEEILPANAVTHHPDGSSSVATSLHGRVPLRTLTQLLGLPLHAFATEGGPGCLLVVHGSDGRYVAVSTPALGQARSVAVRPLPDWLGPPAGVSGLAVLGDGAVAPVLHLPTLLLARDSAAGPQASPATVEDSAQPLCLLVDDSVSVRRAMELFLKDLGLRVLTAPDGSAALELARRQRPALMIADLEMPRMNGIELTSAFRADPSLANVPIIMITSRFSNKHRQRALAAGVTVFLTKPYSEDTVASEIQRCLLRALN